MISHCIFLRWLQLIFLAPWVSVEDHPDLGAQKPSDIDMAGRQTGEMEKVLKQWRVAQLQFFWILNWFTSGWKGFFSRVLGAFGVTRRQAHRNKHLQRSIWVRQSYQRNCVHSFAFFLWSSRRTDRLTLKSLVFWGLSWFSRNTCRVQRWVHSLD